MPMSPLIPIIVFIVLFALILVCILVGFGVVEKNRKQKVAALLGTVEAEAAAYNAPILGDAVPEKGPGFQSIADLPIARRLQEIIGQANLEWSAPGLIFAMLAGGAGGFLAGGWMVRTVVLRESAAVGLGVLFALVPLLYVLRQRQKRLQEFAVQFPEALDFLARSMRAGHALSVGLEMLADESPDPLGTEFRRLFNEQNLGLPMDTAFKNLATRVPLVDVRFFVSAVILQRETGGNLAEILTKLGHVIRERFALKGHIKAASAHGRMSAGVLTVIPVLTALGLALVSPGYYDKMINDKHGRFMILGSVAGQTLGYLMMRKIVNIKV